MITKFESKAKEEEKERGREGGKMNSTCKSRQTTATEHIKHKTQTIRIKQSDRSIKQSELTTVVHSILVIH